MYVNNFVFQWGSSRNLLAVNIITDVYILNEQVMNCAYNTQVTLISLYKICIYCLHGLNAIYLKDYGWYKVDARGNKKGIDAQFNPPLEKLAFELKENEFDLHKIYEEPLNIIIQALEKHTTYKEMIDNMPDIEPNDEIILKKEV